LWAAVDGVGGMRLRRGEGEDAGGDLGEERDFDLGGERE